MKQWLQKLLSPLSHSSSLSFSSHYPPSFPLASTTATFRPMLHLHLHLYLLPRREKDAQETLLNSVFARNCSTLAPTLPVTSDRGTLMEGLIDLEAALCLCIAIKANIFGQEPKHPRLTQLDTQCLQ